MNYRPSVKARLAKQQRADNIKTITEVSIWIVAIWAVVWLWYFAFS